MSKIYFQTMTKFIFGDIFFFRNIRCCQNIQSSAAAGQDPSKIFRRLGPGGPRPIHNKNHNPYSVSSGNASERSERAPPAKTPFLHTLQTYRKEKLKSHLAPASSQSLLLQTECPPSLLHSTSPPGSTTTATSHRIQKFSQPSPLYRISSWQAIVSSPAMTRTHTWTQPWKSPRKYKSIQAAHTCFIIQTCHSALSKQHKRNFSSTHSRSCP